MPELPNGIAVLDKSQTTFPSDSRVTLRCSASSHSNGSAVTLSQSITCDENGTWLGIDQLRSYFCQGMIVVTSGFSFTARSMRSYIAILFKQCPDSVHNVIIKLYRSIFSYRMIVMPAPLRVSSVTYLLWLWFDFLWTAPPSPKRLTITNRTAVSISLQWRPLPRLTADLSWYTVQFKRDASSRVLSVQVLPGKPANGTILWTADGLQPGSVYQFRVLSVYNRTYESRATDWLPADTLARGKWYSLG